MLAFGSEATTRKKEKGKSKFCLFLHFISSVQKNTWGIVKAYSNFLNKVQLQKLFPQWKTSENRNYPIILVKAVSVANLLPRLKIVQKDTFFFKNKPYNQMYVSH